MTTFFPLSMSRTMMMVSLNGLLSDKAPVFQRPKQKAKSFFLYRCPLFHITEQRTHHLEKQSEIVNKKAYKVYYCRMTASIQYSHLSKCQKGVELHYVSRHGNNRQGGTLEHFVSERRLLRHVLLQLQALFANEMHFPICQTLKIIVKSESKQTHMHDWLAFSLAPRTIAPQTKSLSFLFHHQCTTWCISSLSSVLIKLYSCCTTLAYCNQKCAQGKGDLVEHNGLL